MFGVDFTLTHRKAQIKAKEDSMIRNMFRINTNDSEGPKTSQGEKKMVDFNLERAQAGDKVLTLNNQTVEQLAEFRCHSRGEKDTKLMGVVNGVLMYHEAKNLHMEPKPLSGCLSVYSDGTVKIFKTRHDSMCHCAGNVIARIDLSQHNEGEEM